MKAECYTVKSLPGFGPPRKELHPEVIIGSPRRLSKRKDGLSRPLKAIGRAGTGVGNLKQSIFHAIERKKLEIDLKQTRDMFEAL